MKTYISCHEESRRRAGHSITTLARLLGFSHSYVSRVEAGKFSASPRYRAAVSELLATPEGLLFDENGYVR